MDGFRFRKKNGFIFILLFLILLISNYANSVFASSENSGTAEEIRVVLDDNYPPFSFRSTDGVLQGILVDQWALWSKKTGKNATIVGMNWESALHQMRLGRYDVIDTIFYNADRDKYLDFTKWSTTNIEVSIYIQSNITGISDIDSIKGFNIGVKSGDNAISILKQKGADNLIEYSNYQSIIEAVREQKLVAFVMDKPSASYLMYKYDLQDKFNNIIPLYTGEMRRAVFKDNVDMQDLVESGFAKISKEEIDTIDLKWYGIPQSEPLLSPQIRIVLIVVGAAVLLLLVLIMALKKAVNTKTRILSETLEKYKKSENEIYNMSIRDSLTGLYNRNYFENILNSCMEKGKADFGIVVCDIDGLKLINDALGHSDGDEYLKAAANILKAGFDNNDIIARIGGDEFAVLVKDATHEMLSMRKKKIIELMNQSNSRDWLMPISMSIGFHTGQGQKDIREVFKVADNFMYREKLHHMQSEKNNNIRMLSKLLEARDFITEGHGERMQELSVRLAKTAGISEKDIEDMRLFAQFHDIGKIGIPDRILFKPGKLTDEEMAEMKRHTEIGYRIAEASSDIEHISDWILKHHEWWNGQGYPFNLKGEEIPLQCRILSIVDAFDSMTSNRPYRNALSKETAIEEIIRFRGIQFDPALVDIFVGQICAG